MNTYLTIITTILVLTQIIRVTQNAIQLNKHEAVNIDNKYILSVYEKLEKFLDEQEVSDD